MPLIGSISTTDGLFTPNPEGNLRVPCGKCQQCLKQRANEWAMRCQHEMAMHKQNSFITLTYDETNVRSTSEQLRDDIQKFFKKFRKNVKKKIRYIYSVEYGSQTLRPHFHAIIFGHNFPNQELVRKTKKGYPLFTSDQLKKLWSYGHHSIGEANVKTAYYIASYALKKHSAVNETTGEIVSDYMRCSKRPAIGLEYLRKHKKQLVQSQTPLPRYYLKKLKVLDEELLRQYEDRTKEKYSTTDDYQKYAKYLINDANPAKSELRSESNDQKTNGINSWLKNHLKLKAELQLSKDKK